MNSPNLAGSGDAGFRGGWPTLKLRQSRNSGFQGPSFGFAAKGGCFRVVLFPVFCSFRLNHLNFQFQILKFSFRRLFDSDNKPTHPPLRKDDGGMGHPQNLALDSGVNCSSGISHQFRAQSKERWATRLYERYFNP